MAIRFGFPRNRLKHGGIVSSDNRAKAPRRKRGALLLAVQVRVSQILSKKIACIDFLWYTYNYLYSAGGDCLWNTHIKII